MTYYDETHIKIEIKKPQPNETQFQRKARLKRNQMIRQYVDYKCLWYIVMPCCDITSAEDTLEAVYDAGWMTDEQYEAWQVCRPIGYHRGY